MLADMNYDVIDINLARPVKKIRRASVADTFSSLPTMARGGASRS